MLEEGDRATLVTSRCLANDYAYEDDKPVIWTTCTELTGIKNESFISQLLLVCGGLMQIKVKIFRSNLKFAIVVLLIYQP